MINPDDAFWLFGCDADANDSVVVEYDLGAISRHAWSRHATWRVPSCWQRTVASPNGRPQVGINPAHNDFTFHCYVDSKDSLTVCIDDEGNLNIGVTESNITTEVALTHSDAHDLARALTLLANRGALQKGAT
jgi:hypothetical protein